MKTETGMKFLVIPFPPEDFGIIFAKIQLYRYEFKHSPSPGMNYLTIGPMDDATVLKFTELYKKYKINIIAQ